MKKHRMPDMKEGGVNVTPLIDIVRVLIVFFMLVAKIGVSRGEDQDIPLPSTIIGKALDSLSNTLTLNVHYNRVLKAFATAHSDKANVIIRADKDLPYHQLELVLLSVSNAGIGNVSYETKSGEDTGPATPGAGTGG